VETYFTTKGLSEYLKIPEQSIRRWVLNNEIPFHRIHNVIRYRLSEIDEFIKTYGQEFDRQCLLADNDPFTGAMACADVTEVAIKGNTINDLTWKDFRDAVYKVGTEERKDCAWFINETVLNHIANIEDTTGRPIWRRPTQAMPDRLNLYLYHKFLSFRRLRTLGRMKFLLSL
jgi:excisionase family DNA binding protein